MTYYQEKDGKITRSTPFLEVAKSWGDYQETDKNILRGYDGNLYFADELPEKPQSVINAERIAELKQFLCDADYWGQKYIDGEYTEAEWEEKKAQRKAWREEIRSLENQAGEDQ